MNAVAILFVPTGASRQDFEKALREHMVSLDIDEPIEDPATDRDEPPFWTWFLPNPRPGLDYES